MNISFSKPQKALTMKSQRCKAIHLIICCLSQITVRASASLRFYRQCASNPPPTATASPNPSAAVTEAVAGDHSASSAPCLALCSTRRCVHMGRATPPTAGVREGRFKGIYWKDMLTMMWHVLTTNGSMQPYTSRISSTKIKNLIIFFITSAYLSHSS